MTAPGPETSRPARTGSSLGALRALLVASILGPALLFGVAAVENRRQVVHEAEQTVRRTTAVMHEHALKVFETHELVLNQIDQHIQGMSWEEIERSASLRLFLARLDRGLTQVASLWVSDAAGYVRSGSIPYRAGLNGLDRDFFLEQRDRDQGTYVGKAYVGRTTNRPSFGVSRRRSSTGGFDGIIHVAVSSEYFSDFFRSAAPDIPHFALLVRADGEVLAWQPEAQGIGSFPADSPFRRAIGESDIGFLQGPLTIDGPRQSYAFRRLGAYPLYIAFGISREVVLASWYANLVAYGALAVAISAGLVGTTLVAIRRTRREQQALARLTEETHRRAAAEEGLRQTQKMEALGQLTGGVAHDFNNLLTVIGGNLALLDGRLADAKLQRRVDLAQKAVERAAKLTQHLLAFARRQPLQPTTIDLNVHIADMSDLLERSLRSDVVVETDLAPDLWPVEVDPQQLELAVLNIAVNARDAMPGGGRLRIATDNARLPDGHPSGLAGDYVALTITDSGSGIPPEVIGRVFDPFFTTKEVGKGTGLGLSQVYGFAKQSGGSALVESRPQHGTTLTLLLPRSRMPVPIAAAAVGAPALPASHVLLVEDDLDVADTATSMLSGLGHRVTAVSDAAAALQALEDGPVDLVFSDVAMPGGLSGTELARAINRRWPHLPVLLATGYSEKLIEAGDWPILLKPYRLEDLAAALAEIGRGRTG